ncbi:MAG: pentapeptide repeat-containing protein [Caldilineaceae bacterium]
MNEDRMKVLELLQTGKISVDEAARLLEAMDLSASAPAKAEQYASPMDSTPVVAGGRTKTKNKLKLPLQLAKDIQLTGATLTGFQFEGADLGRTNFEGADLTNADFRGANLRDAYLGGANLRDANFQNANLKDANLGGGNFKGANFANANLADANLEGANFANANLQEADLHEADLSGADFADADLRSKPEWPPSYQAPPTAMAWLIWPVKGRALVGSLVSRPTGARSTNEQTNYQLKKMCKLLVGVGIGR